MRAKPNLSSRKGQLTHREIGTLLGISRGLVFQLEHRALAKIRNAFQREADARGVNIRDLFYLDDADSTREVREVRRLSAEFERSVRAKR